MAHTFDTSDMSQCPFMPVFGAPALSMERGSGTEVWDTSGKRYLDFLTGIAVTSLGHANPVIADAICRQANTLLHVSNFFTNPQATAAAVKVNELLEDATGHAGQIFFTNSGAESNECALKLARKWGGRGRHTVVSTFGSFHGRTLATLAATGQPAKHEPFAPMPEGFKHVVFGDIDQLRASVDASVAAVINERIPASEEVAEDSFNILSAILGVTSTRPLRPSMILHSPNGNFAIRQGPWKYIEGKASPTLNKVSRRDELVVQLYNLLDDPGEQNNVLNQHPEVVRRLAGLLNKRRLSGWSRE